MKSALPSVLAVAALGASTTASAAILIDGDFTGLSGPANVAFQQSLRFDGTNDSTGLGFLARTADINFVNGQALVSGIISGSNGGDTFPAGGFGQVNDDNFATTGPVSFTFDVAEVTDGDSFDFVVELFDVTGAAAFERIRLSTGTNAGTFTAGVTQIGTQVSTGVITGPGTFTTGTIDLGSGFESVAIRITPLNDGDTPFNDIITLNSITVNGGTPIPEPASAGLAAAGLALLAGRRSRKA